LAAYGRVELLPSGQILVNANADTLEQVERVLQAIQARSAAATPRAALRYWAVLGSTASDVTPRDAGVRVEVVPNSGNAQRQPMPPVLNGVLSDVRGVIHGDLTFSLLGTAALATNYGQFGQVDGTTLKVEQTAHVQHDTSNEDTLNAAISLELMGPGPPGTFGNVKIGSLSLRTTLRRGEFVVLGESHVQVGENNGPVFYIVHWE
jgi:hypothetical protein